MQQLTFFDPQLPAPPPLPTSPTMLILSSSGGIDSSAAALTAIHRYPAAPRVLWHAYLDKMVYPEDDAVLVAQAAALDARLVVVQVVYRLTGELTPTGANGTTLARIHTVRDGDAYVGPAALAPGEIGDLLTFAKEARNGQPPTSKIRWCTDYFKIRACDAWLRANRALLGDAPILVTGERHAESIGRSTLPETQWRWETRRNDVCWWRPVVRESWQHCVAACIDARIPIHPAYGWQGETLATMTDPDRIERGRPRLSCAVCIFAHQRHIAAARAANPASVAPLVAAVQQFESDTGYTWQQRGALLPGA